MSDDDDLGTFRIKVIDEHGDGVSMAKVSVHYAAFLAGPGPSDYTDSDGLVEFPIQRGAPWGSLIQTVYVNHEKVGGGFTPMDGYEFSFNRPKK